MCHVQLVVTNTNRFREKKAIFPAIARTEINLHYYLKRGSSCADLFALGLGHAREAAAAAAALMGVASVSHSVEGGQICRLGRKGVDFGI